MGHPLLFASAQMPGYYMRSSSVFCPGVQLPIDLVSLLNAVQGRFALVQAFIKALIDLLQLSQFSYCLP